MENSFLEKIILEQGERFRKSKELFLRDKLRERSFYAIIDRIDAGCLFPRFNCFHYNGWEYWFVDAEKPIFITATKDNDPKLSDDAFGLPITMTMSFSHKDSLPDDFFLFNKI